MRPFRLQTASKFEVTVHVCLAKYAKFHLNRSVVFLSGLTFWNCTDYKNPQNSCSIAVLHVTVARVIKFWFYFKHFLDYCLHTVLAYSLFSFYIIFSNRLDFFFQNYKSSSVGGINIGITRYYLLGAAIFSQVSIDQY